MAHFFINLIGIIVAIARIKKGDVILLQYPLKKYYETVCKAAHLRGAKVITLIHDLNSFRSQRLTVSQEIKRVNHSDVIIAPQRMKDWLVGNGCKAKFEIHKVWDYLTSKEIVSQRALPDFSNKDVKLSLFFVGKLTPTSNHFVYDLGETMPQTPFYLYGTNYAPELLLKPSQTEYLGFAQDEQLIECNRGDFGVSWYGDSLHHGSGRIGEYMTFNNPHKVSLYLRCNVPVIVWKNAGIAAFIQENECGILVESLENIEETLSKITETDYQRLMNNVRNVSQKLSQGYYFESALKNAIQLL